MRRNIVIITAAGAGKRMGSSKKKQYIKLLNEPILYYTFKTFVEHPQIDTIIPVIPKDDLDIFNEIIIERFNSSKINSPVFGGKERQDSVYNGLKSIAKSLIDSIVLIHDGVRPFISSEIISRSIESMSTHKASIVGVKVKDTLKLFSGEEVRETINRSRVVSVQTPQTFIVKDILSSYKKAEEKSFRGTDDASLFEKFGNGNIKIVEGSYNNIKITTSEDLIFGEAILKNFKT
ncbi:MAG: 2-C-methyl-D-erythritol 4-phosphate cytidylyltransferase [Candidatus Cloacimonadota bacterium]|nr:MAG: 2-C-methyl-D-erythritol 4-phosphate cytidylyltransferase [Candidatus Cloacimonadota bacterium]PIE79332.1 MAG: 2-C-methyl-D-erythritol 4-phosphate cytidylyltransferase [Candidatus Delongbacteria bacterium]